MYGASTALGGLCRSARRNGSAAGSARSPEGQDSSTIRIPLQNEPNAIHGVPSASVTTPGSMALKSSPPVDTAATTARAPTTNPVRRHEDGRRVIGGWPDAAWSTRRADGVVRVE